MRAPTPILLAAALCACASSGSVGGGAVTHVRMNPLVLSGVADTTALLRALAADPAVTAAADSVLLRIGYDSTGALTPVSVAGVDIPEAESERIAEVVAAELSPTSLPLSYGTFLFERGPRPRILPFRYTTEREPRLLNRQEISGALQTIATRQGYRDRSATIWIYVTGRGEPARAEVHGSSGNIDTDRELLAVARRARFSPARLDRFPIPVWVALPLSIRNARLQVSPANQPPRTDPMVGRGRRDW